MSSIQQRREQAEAGLGRDGYGDLWEDGFARPRVMLQPIAAPSVLGLFGFAGATFIVAANLAGWFGTAASPGYLFPFAMFFGGLAQFTAGMWAYRARDAVATAMHGMWGSFWLAYGLLQLLIATGTLASGTTLDHALGFWFIALCALTFSGMLGALAEGNIGVVAVLGTLAAGCGFAAVGFLQSDTYIQHWAGWVFIVSACLAWYVGTAMMLKAAAGRTVLPLFRVDPETNVPGGHPTRAIQLTWGEPGIKAGQ